MKGLNEIIADNNRAARDELNKRIAEKENADSKKREPIHYSPFDALVMRAQKSLKDNGYLVSYYILADAIYDPWNDLSIQLQIGDSLELPNGTTLTCTWKPSTKD